MICFELNHIIKPYPSVKFHVKCSLIKFQASVLFGKGKLLIDVSIPVFVELARVSSAFLGNQDRIFDSLVTSDSVGVVNVIVAISMNHVSWNSDLIKWEDIFVVIQVDFVSVVMWVKSTQSWEDSQAFFHVLHSWVCVSNFGDFIGLFLGNGTFLLIVGGHSISRDDTFEHSWHELAAVIAQGWRFHHTSSISVGEHFIHWVIIASCCGAAHAESLNSIRILDCHSDANDTSSRSNNDWKLFNFEVVHQGHDEISLGAGLLQLLGHWSSSIAWAGDGNESWVVLGKSNICVAESWSSWHQKHVWSLTPEFVLNGSLRCVGNQSLTLELNSVLVNPSFLGNGLIDAHHEAAEEDTNRH